MVVEWNFDLWNYTQDQVLALGPVSASETIGNMAGAYIGLGLNHALLSGTGHGGARKQHWRQSFTNIGLFLFLAFWLLSQP